MRTFEEMYNYAKENGYGTGLTKGWSKKHFKVLESNLRKDEEVYMTFIGFKDMKGMNHDSTCAYAITNERMILGQKKVIGENFVAVVLDNINDISLNKKLAYGIITFDTIKETFNVGVLKNTSQNIMEEASRIIFDMRKGDLSSVGASKGEGATSTVDEIRKYKELLDDGIITEDEFNQKKKELLGI